MSKLAPAKLAGLIMGLWFLGTALGNKLAGVLAESFSSKDPIVLSRFFLNQALIVGVVTVVLLAMVPWVKRRMGHHS